MKNLSRRDFLRLSGAAVFAVGMTERMRQQPRCHNIKNH